MPMLSYHWQRWRENLAPVQTVHESYLASYAAKWYGSEEIMYDGLNNYDYSIEDEKHVAATLWELLNEADILVHFNGDRFDNKVANTAFVKYGFKPPMPSHNVDLFKQVKKHFRFSSNKLSSVCEQLGLENKEDTEGWKLWIKCVNGDREAWDTMENYNVQDVIVTEQLYEKVLPWVHNHPNVNILNDEAEIRCCNCGSDLVIKKGFQTTKAGVYQRYRCNSCGAPLRGKTMVNTREQREVLTTR